VSATRFRACFFPGDANFSVEYPRRAVRLAQALGKRGRFAAPGNPVATHEAILTLADSDNPPLRLFLGKTPLRIALADSGSRLSSWAQWQQVAEAAQGS
jgi:hypothetical protein